MHPLPSKLVFSTGQNQPEGVQNRKISPDGDHASALIFGGPVLIKVQPLRYLLAVATPVPSQRNTLPFLLHVYHASGIYTQRFKFFKNNWKETDNIAAT